MVPKRARTRAQNRANRINSERRRNRQTRLAAHGPPPNPDEPPPF
jgi:hypothetical protein